MPPILLKNATVVNEGFSFKGGIFVQDGLISDIFNYELPTDCERQASLEQRCGQVYELEGRYLLPGVIDTHVHFREPGATEKGCIATESRAAVAGGVTSFLDMPNNNPPASDAAAIAAKIAIAERDSAANYGFYLGATGSNIGQIRGAAAAGACAVKVFMGSSTGSLLVDDPLLLREVFEASPLMVAAHCEDNVLIRANLERYKKLYGNDIPISAHPQIRSREACLAATRRAVETALAARKRLHIMHVSTLEEVEYLSQVMLSTDLVSAETCVQYLWFDDSDYERYGAQIKCNPAIKTPADREALCEAVRSGVISIISTDHAPHLPEQKAGGCLQAASGIPLVQYSLLMMLEKVRQGVFSLPLLVEKMCHAPARLFGIDRRGFIRKGHYADLVAVDAGAPSDVAPLSRCGWSPLTSFSYTIEYTFVNGALAARNGAACNGPSSAMKLNHLR